MFLASHNSSRQTLVLKLLTKSPSCVLYVLLTLVIPGCSDTHLDEQDSAKNAARKGSDAEEREAVEVLERMKKHDPDAVSDRLNILPINHTLFRALCYQENVYESGALGKDLRAGLMTEIHGLETQRLRFALPMEELRCWGENYKTLFVVSQIITDNGMSVIKPGIYGPSKCEVLRIDTRTWKATHAFRCLLPHDAVEIKGLELTSEGLVVAISGSYQRLLTKQMIENKLIKKFHDAGSVFDVNINHLMVLDPDSLNMKKLLLGPSLTLTGSKASPVVCVADRENAGVLVDLRNGQVLDRIERKTLGERFPGFRTLRNRAMSPDGSMLYCSGYKSTDIQRFDLSKGNFELTSPLQSHQPVMKVSRYGRIDVPDREGIRISPDGSLVVARTVTGSRIDYVSVSANGDEEPIVSGRTPEFTSTAKSTDFTFIGTGNGLAYNSTYRSVQDLVTPQQAYRLRKEVPKSGVMSLFGTPISDHVLVGTPLQYEFDLSPQELMTLWVRVPAENLKSEPFPEIEVVKAKISGSDPDDPLLFLDGPNQGFFDRGEGLARAEVPSRGMIDCSADGKLLYYLGEEGLLRAIDTELLREVRTARIGKKLSDDDRFEFRLTKSGILARRNDSGVDWFELLDGTSLDGIARFKMNGYRLLATSPGTSLVCVKSPRGDLELFDLHEQKPVSCYNRTETARLPKSDSIYDNRSRTLHAAVMSYDGSAVVCLFGRQWQYFDIADNGSFTHLGFLEWREQPVGVPIPMPSLEKCYFNFRNKKGFAYCELSDHAKPLRLLTIPLLNNLEVQATYPNGWIYAQKENTISVYTYLGKRLYNRFALPRDKGVIDFVAVPGRPTRIFALGRSWISVADLDTPSGQKSGLRKWKHHGKMIVAKFAEMDGADVIIESARGQRKKLLLKSLSDEDRQYIKDQQKPKKHRP